MGMHFENPIDDETMDLIKKKFIGHIAVADQQNILLEKLNEKIIHQKDMSEIARKANQPATLKMYDQDDVVEMTDGTKYQVTKSGWKKLI